MSMAAISTAAAAEPGRARVRVGIMGGGHDRVVASFGGDQALLAALAELFGMLGRALGGGVGGPCANILANAGNDTDEGADRSRPDDGAPVR